MNSEYAVGRPSAKEDMMELLYCSFYIVLQIFVFYICIFRICIYVFCSHIVNGRVYKTIFCIDIDSNIF